MKDKVCKGMKIIGYVLFVPVLILGVLAFGIDRWLFHTWSELSYEEIAFHLKSSIEGTNPDMIVHAIVFYAVPVVLVCAAVIVGVILLRHRKRGKVILMSVATLLSISLFVFTLYDMQTRIQLLDHIRDEGFSSGEDSGDTFIKDHYVDPAAVELTFPQQKRNLIYIFLESMEMTYADEANGGAFPKNVIPELTEIAKTYDDFSGDEAGLDGAYSLPGATWTMGGMFAQTAGAPLKISMNHNAMSYVDAFFPGMTTLGDVLQDQGYHQILSVGSDSVFGGRRKYFESHGDYEIRDYPYSIEQKRVPEDYHVWWGIEDEKLFAFAKEDLLELAKADEPFNYTMLTVDTHFEDGYTCHLCKEEFGDNVYANVMACSSRQVEDFISWCQKQDFYENTTIVLCGDHPTMDTDFCDDVPKSYDRRTYTAIINGAPTERDENAFYRTYSTMDLYPTTLAALGVDIDGNQLGMGVNLYSNKPTLLELYGVKECTKKLSRSSSYLESAFGDTLTETVLEGAAANSIITAVFEQTGKDTYHAYFYYFPYGDVNFSLDFDNTDARMMVSDPKTDEESSGTLQTNKEFGIGMFEMDVQTDDITSLDYTMYVMSGSEIEHQYRTGSVSDHHWIMVLSEDHQSLDVLYKPYKEEVEGISFKAGINHSDAEDHLVSDASLQENGYWHGTFDFSEMEFKGVLEVEVDEVFDSGEEGLLEKTCLHMKKFPFIR